MKPGQSPDLRREQTPEEKHEFINASLGRLESKLTDLLAKQPNIHIDRIKVRVSKDPGSYSTIDVSVILAEDLESLDQRARFRARESTTLRVYPQPNETGFGVRIVPDMPGDVISEVIVQQLKEALKQIGLTITSSRGL